MKANFRLLFNKTSSGDWQISRDRIQRKTRKRERQRETQWKERMGEANHELGESLRTKREREKEADQKTWSGWPRSPSVRVALLRVVMPWLLVCDGDGSDLARVCSWFSGGSGRTRGRPGALLAVLRRGSFGWWGWGGSGVLMALRINVS